MDFSFITDDDQRMKAEEAFNKSLESVKAEVSTTLRSEFDKEVEGLKTNNSKLIEEKRKVQETLKNFDGLDPQAAKEALAFINENEQAQLLKEGKLDEVVERRVQELKDSLEGEVQTLTKEKSEVLETAKKYQTMYSSKMVDDSLREAASKAGILPQAIDDVLNKGRGVFGLGEDEMSVEARDKKGDLMRTEDGKILTTTLWIDQLRQESPHYWPQSKGANFDSSTIRDMDDLDTKIVAAAEADDQDLFRKLRAEKRKRQGK